MEIQSATAADAEALCELHAETWADAYAELLPAEFYARRLDQHRRRDWRRVIAEQIACGGGVLVAREPSGAVGLCQYGPSQDENDRSPAVGHVRRLYVHPFSQGRGVGRALLAAAGERLVAGGARSATLWVLESDPRARGFYEHLGWQADGRRRFEGAVDVRYRRALEAGLS